jgi:hypothetical protein
MSFLKQTYEKHRGIALVVVAVMGGALGFAVAARKAAACSCMSPDVWSLSLESVTSSDPAVDHTPLWPDGADLIEEPQRVVFTLRLRGAWSDGSVKEMGAQR